MSRSESGGSGYIGILRSLNRNVWLYIAVVFGGLGFTFFGIYQVTFNLYVVRLGYGPEQIGDLLSLLTLSLAVFSIPAGLLGTRFRRKILTAIGIFLIAGSYIVAIAVPVLVPGSRFGGLAVGIVVMGLGSAMMFANGGPLFMSFTRPEQRPVAFALSASVEPLGGFVGSLVAGFLPGLIGRFVGSGTEDYVPFQWTLIAAVVTATAAGIAVLATREPRDKARASDEPDQGRSVGEGAGKPSRFILPVMVTLVIAFAAATRSQTTFIPRSFFNIYVEEILGRGVAEIGTALGFAQLITIPIILSVPLLIVRIGKVSTFVVGMAVSVGGAALIGFVPVFVAAVAAVLIVNLGFGVSNTIYNQYCLEIFQPRARSIAAGIVVLAQMLGMSASNFAAGRLIPTIGYRKVFLLAGIVGIACAAVFGIYFRKPRGEYAGTPR